MSFKSIILFTALSLFFMSCGDDEVIPCSQAAWVGQYTGESDCSGDTITGNATVEITPSESDNIVIRLAINSNSMTLDPPAKFEDCNVSLTTADLTLTGTLDGDEIVINTTMGATNCTYTVSRI